MLPQHSQKPLSLYKFSSKHLVDVRKKYIGATQFLGAQELHSKSTLKVHVCIFLYIALRKFLFQRRSKLLSGFIFYLMNNFVNAARCLGFRKIFYSFSL